MCLIPFSDGEYQWSTYMLTRKDSEKSQDILLFQKHILDWMSGIKNGKIIR